MAKAASHPGCEEPGVLLGSHAQVALAYPVLARSHGRTRSRAFHHTVAVRWA